MFSLGDELCGGFFYEVAFFNLVLSVLVMVLKFSAPRQPKELQIIPKEASSLPRGNPYREH